MLEPVPASGAVKIALTSKGLMIRVEQRRNEKGQDSDEQATMLADQVRVETETERLRHATRDAPGVVLGLRMVSRSDGLVQDRMQDAPYGTRAM